MFRKPVLFLLCVWGSVVSADSTYPMGVIKTPVADYETIPFFAVSGLKRDIKNRFVFDPLPSPGYQGDQYSCTGWAIAHAAKTITYSQKHNLEVLDDEDYFSPAFIYNQSDPADCRTGVQLSTALYAFEIYGAAKAIDFPYVPDNCSRLPSNDVLQKAAKNAVLATGKVTESWGITNTELVEIKTLLSNGYPVIVSIDTYSDFHNWEGKTFEDVYSKKNDVTHKGEHALSVVGYDDEKNAVLLINSWGNRWGSDGFVWMDYRTFQSITLEAFVFLDK